MAPVELPTPSEPIKCIPTPPYHKIYNPPNPFHASAARSNSDIFPYSPESIQGFPSRLNDRPSLPRQHSDPHSNRDSLFSVVSPMSASDEHLGRTPRYRASAQQLTTTFSTMGFLEEFRTGVGECMTPVDPVKMAEEFPQIRPLFSSDQLEVVPPYMM